MADPVMVMPAANLVAVMMTTTQVDIDAGGIGGAGAQQGEREGGSDKGFHRNDPWVSGS